MRFGSNRRNGISGKPRAVFAARGGDPGPHLPDESDNRVARRGGCGGWLRRLSLDGDCRVVFANAKAEDLIRRGTGLRYEHGRLVAATPSLTARLRALVRDGAQPDRADGDIGGTLELPSGENRPPLIAHVFPLAANRMVSIFDIDRPSAAVFIVDPAAGFGAQIRRFGENSG